MSRQPAGGSRWKLPFFSIWTGQAISLIGSQIVQFALVWWLTQRTGSATVLASATLVAMLPMIVVGPFAGALVARWNRRLVMIVADGFVALASLWQVYVVMFVRALGGSFHWPAMLNIEQNGHDHGAAVPAVAQAVEPVYQEVS